MKWEVPIWKLAMLPEAPTSDLVFLEDLALVCAGCRILLFGARGGGFVIKR